MPHVAVVIQDKEVPVQLMNPTDSFITLKKGYDKGYLEEVSEIFEDPDEAIVDEKLADNSAFCRGTVCLEQNQKMYCEHGGNARND